MHKIRIFSVILALCMLCTACRPHQTAEPVSLFPKPEEAPTAILLTLAEESSSFPHDIAIHFQETLKELSGGTIIVDVLTDSKLGGTEYADGMLSDGRVQMRLGSGPSKLLRMLAMPTVSQATPDTVYSAFDEPAWCALIDRECAEFGIRFLSIALAEYLIVSSSTPIEDTAGFRDLRMRYSEDGFSESVWQPFGVTPVYIENDRITAAVSSGVVDAVTDITLADYLTYRRYLQQPYVMEMHQGLAIHSFYINNNFYLSLSEHDRKLIERAVTETVRWAQSASAEQLAPLVAEAEKNGMQIVSFSRETLHPMYIRNSESVCSYLEKYLGTELMQEGLSALRYVSPKS